MEDWLRKEALSFFLLETNIEWLTTGRGRKAGSWEMSTPHFAKMTLEVGQLWASTSHPEDRGNSRFFFHQCN